MIAGFICRECGHLTPQPGYCPADGTRLEATEDPLLGHEVGRYRLARLLGEGGMGRVYLAVQPAIGSRVAIKILSDQCARSPELLERFFAEARAVNLIRHEHIVGVLDLAQLADGRPYIVMEFIEGRTLAELLRTGPLPLGGLVQLAAEVLSALAAAHAIGIVHRDLKPDNVLVTAEGHAKVLDFGIAKLAPQLQQALSPRTQTGALLGTPQYMAPEQITGAGNVDARSDVYAAGVMLFEAMCGVRPFRGETMYDLMRAHLEEPPPSLRALRAEVPAALEQVVFTALAKAPAQRFPGAAELSAALQQAAQGLPPEQWRPLSMQGRAHSSPVVSHARSPLPMQLMATKQPVATERSRASARWPLVVAAFLALVAVAVVVALVLPKGAELGSTASGSDPAPASGSALIPGSNSVTAPVSGSGPGPGSVPAAGSGSVTASASASASASAPAPAPAAGSGSVTAPAPAAGSGSVTAPASASASAPAPSTSDSRTRPRASSPSAPVAKETAPDAGPTIVGGGSAADHGVHIGPGVELGPNVIIGSSPPSAKKSATAPRDFDPRRFDPVAYLPKARALAKTLLPDAELTSFSFDPVFSDGRVDLTMDGRDREYEFRSPSRSPAPAGTPRNLPVDRACRVMVQMSPSGAEARVLSSDSCDDRLVRSPRCSFAGVWKHALAAGVPPDYVARVAWLSDQKWFFDTDLAGNGGGVSSFSDRCP